MMKKMKWISLTLCAVICLSLFAGCGSKAKKDENVLTVATHATFPPYEFYKDGKIVGIDIEIMQAICDKIGYTMNVADMEFGSIITAVASGKADVGAAGITKTEDRAKSVNFTDSYATAIQSVIIKEDSGITSIEDLHADDIMIGVQQDTTGDIYATKDFGEDHIIKFNKGADAVQALVTGKCQAVITDNEPAKAYLAMNDGLTILPTAYAEEEYSYEISYDKQELYDKVNGALQALIADGTVQKIVDSYITAK